MKIKVKIKNKEYEVEIIDNNQGEVNIKIGNNTFNFNSTKNNVNPEIIPLIDESSILKKEIKAPLSGIVSEIFIKEGDSVKKGDKLLVLSAMKMENEIISESEGKIKKILVGVNQKVKEEDILISLF